MEDGMRPVWSQAVCQAIAHQESMPDLAVRQMQYVLYHGRNVAKPSAHGWLKSVSDERAANLAMQPRAPPRAIAPGGPAARPGAQHAEHSTVAGDVEVNRATLPEGLQLVITDSPAEFCLPQPRCRAFKPHFQAKVCIQSAEGQALHMPIRVKAYAISRDDRGRVAEWSPPEVSGAAHINDRANILGPYASTGAELKGPNVISYTVDTRTDVRQDGDAADAPGGADASSDGGRQILHDSHSIVPRMDDPDMIAAACAGTNPATRTTVVHFNFKGLEFAHPTRMSPVWMVFACLIGQDLLYTLYDVPSICISRTNQRGNALARLGLPRTAFDDVDEARWKSSPDACRTAAMQSGPPHAAGLPDCHFAEVPDSSMHAAGASPGAGVYGSPVSDGMHAAVLSGGLSMPQPGDALAGSVDMHMASGSFGADLGASQAGRECSDSDDDSEWMAIQREAWMKGLLGQDDWAMAGSMSGSGAAGPHFNAPPVSTPQHLHGTAGTAGTPAMAASPVQQVAPARKQSPPADWALKLQQVYMSDAGQGHRPGQTSMRDQHMSHGGSAQLPQRHSSANWDGTRPPSSIALRKRALSFDAPDHDSASSPSATKHCVDRRADSDALMHGLQHRGGQGSPMSPHGHSSAPAAFEDMGRGRAAADPLFDSMRAQTASSQTAAAPLDKAPVPPDAQCLADVPWPPASGAEVPHHVLTGSQSLPPYPPGHHAPRPLFRSSASDTQLPDPLNPSHLAGGLQARSAPGRGAAPPPPPHQDGAANTWPGGPAHALEQPPPGPVMNRPKPLQPRCLSMPRTPPPGSPSAVTQPLQLPGAPATSQGLPPGAAEPYLAPQAVSQEQVYKWVVSAYLASGLKRRLTHHDYKVLLSFAGFPAAAGVDLQARIEPSQFNAFRSFFAGALRVLACAQRIWDHASHDVICGFGVSHHHVSETLSTQPVGTFLCYLSMPPTCELVIACKVTVHVPGADKAHVLHVTVTEDDMHRLGLEQIVMGLPYATHLLDNRSGHRIDKRGLLPGSAVTVRSVFAALVADDDHDPDRFPPSWGPKPGLPDASAVEAMGWGPLGRQPEGVVGLSVAQALCRNGDMSASLGRDGLGAGMMRPPDWRERTSGHIEENDTMHGISYVSRHGA